MNALPDNPNSATRLLPQDSYPFEIIGRTAKTITVKELKHLTFKDGFEPSGYCNGFPVWDHYYTAAEIATLADPNGRVMTLRMHKDGRYYDSAGIPFAIGFARYYRNFAD